MIFSCGSLGWKDRTYELTANRQPSVTGRSSTMNHLSPGGSASTLEYAPAICRIKLFSEDGVMPKRQDQRNQSPNSGPRVRSDPGTGTVSGTATIGLTSTNAVPGSWRSRD